MQRIYGLFVFLLAAAAVADVVVIYDDDYKYYTLRANNCLGDSGGPLIISGDSVVSVNMRQGAAVSEKPEIIYDRRYDGWASQQLFSRFRLDPMAKEDWSALSPELKARFCGAGVHP